MVHVCRHSSSTKQSRQRLLLESTPSGNLEAANAQACRPLVLHVHHR